MRKTSVISALRLPLSALGRRGRAFTLVEILVVVALLSFIVLALMAVFSSTQRAFRASVTQTDVLETGRSTVDLITSDLRGMTPSYGAVSNGPVNFYVLANNYGYRPLQQSLPGSSIRRTNLLNYFFVLGRENTKWTGVGYVVDTISTNSLYPLYRFYVETNTVNSPLSLVAAFNNAILNAQWTNMSHLVDGVVQLKVRAFDREGRWLQQEQVPYYTNCPGAVFVFPPAYGFSYGESQLFMFSNAVPASVELEMGVLEDRAIARAESLPDDVPALPPNDRRTFYLQDQAGSTHIFRQRVNIPNFDPSAYQP